MTDASLEELWHDQLELIHSVFPPDDDIVWSQAALRVLDRQQSESVDSQLHVVARIRQSDAAYVTLRLSLSSKSSQYGVQAVSSSRALSDQVKDLDNQLVALCEANDDAFSSFMAAVELARSVLDGASELASAEEPPTASTAPRESADEAIVRAWFHFPSLSTRSKRKDLVTYAQSRGLTGFVLAGKPGLCVLEGEPSRIDSYWQAIKTKSWADIPSFQKKVSERVRKPIRDRKWDGVMEEITDRIEKGGYRGNKGEMGQVREYCDGHGTADELDIVLRIPS